MPPIMRTRATSWRFLAAAVGLALGLIQDERALAQWPQNAPPNAPSNLSQALQEQGCAISAGGLPQLPSDIMMSVITPNRDDEKEIFRGFDNGYRIFGRLFDVDPAYGIYEDDSPNAFALARDLSGLDSPDGLVLIGRNLIRAEQQGSKRLWQAVITFVFAHEFAHTLQFKRAIKLPTRQSEFLSDYLAGWAIGRENRSDKRFFTDADSVVKALLDKRYYRFNAESSHGTPDQRIAAFRAGLRSGEGYADLDDAIAEGISAAERL